MNRPRGRPALGKGLTREDILAAALTLLDDGGGQGLTMRALAARLGVTPMSLYHHVEDRAALLRALSDRVYVKVLDRSDAVAEPRQQVRAMLIRYHNAVHRHPQLTMAIFATPEAFAGVTRQITERLTELLAEITTKPALWRDILIDHAHGSGMPPLSTGTDQRQLRTLQEQYRQSVDCLLSCLTRS